MFKSLEKIRQYSRWSVTLLLILAGTSQATETALDRYVAKPDSNYTYRNYLTKKEAGYTAYFLEMTSQQWRSAAEVDRPLWKHEIAIVIPQLSLDSSDTAILLITGGDNIGDPLDDLGDADPIAGAAAVAAGTVLAVVRQIPNQPLYFADDPEHGRQEDEILGYSLDKALDTGDPEWAVHLAMTKAAVRAMDTVQAFAAEKGRTIKNFLLIGGSKRGWTTWLAAAVDKRVKAIVPASIDMLNLGQQFIHHWEAYGFFAPALRDYVEFDLPCRLQTSQGQELLQIVDPYAYRDRYTMPKLILNATGDQFFVTDSSRFYYGDLLGPKWMRYTPNTDHAQNDDALLKSLSWIDDILDNKTSPQITWTLEDDGTLKVTPTAQPKTVRLWQATNPNARDFRLEAIGPVWTSQVLTAAADGSYIGGVQQPAKGWTAFFIEVTFPTAGVIEPDQVYSTGVQIIPDTLPYAGTACGGNHKANLESPYQSSFESGIGLIRGWVCQANTVEVQIDGGERRKVAYGTTRKDTAEVCGDDNNGFGYTFNWNALSTGAHRLQAFADNVEFANVTFNVTNLGEDYLRGVSGEYTLQDFPQAGKNVTVRWAEPHQNFVIAGADPVPASARAAAPFASSLANLESPQQGSFESGIGLIRGWVCQADTVEVQIDGGERRKVAYGTTRKDTIGVCGDDNNGFGYTFNWNALGTGTHTLRAFADDAEFANVPFSVTTLGVDYLQGASGEYPLSNFPQAGKNITLRWSEPHQNFVIVDYR
ncbi:MAG TPA: PhoPQ-activated protein PqaA family protein [Candidatus Competibacter sp.]|nr:PhoPQ-activated protein PqaA family protein [Candidatus Competibacter sp.]